MTPPTPPIDWGTLLSEGGELAFLVAITGLIYRFIRIWSPDVPEALVQIIAAILSTAFNLMVLWEPGMLMHQWITIGIARGVLRSQNVVKSMDWAVSAVTKTGAPQAGLPEKPPAWFVAELVKGTAVKAEEPRTVTVQSKAGLQAQIKKNEELKARAAAERFTSTTQGE